MIKSIAMDLGGVYFEDGTSVAVEKISALLNVPKETVDEVFRSGPKKEGWMYRTGKLTKEEFWDAAAKKLGVDKKEIPKIQEIWHSSYVPIEGMEKLVFGLRKNYRMLVFSANIQERIDYLDKKYKLRERFDDFVFSFQTGLGKDDAEMYKILLARAKCKPDECVLVDDTDVILDVAKSIGIRTILFRNPEQLKAELRVMGVKI